VGEQFRYRNDGRALRGGVESGGGGRRALCGGHVWSKGARKRKYPAQNDKSQPLHFAPRIYAVFAQRLCCAKHGISTAVRTAAFAVFTCVHRYSAAPPKPE